MQSQEDTSKLHLRNEELSKEILQLKGINSMLRTESEEKMKLQKMEQQVNKCIQYILSHKTILKYI